MTDGFDVSTGGAYVVLYSVLGIFMVLAIISAGYGAACLPSKVKELLVAHNRGDEASAATGDESIRSSEMAEEEGTSKEAIVAGGKGILATDFFLSARNSTGTFGIAMSFFASGMGAWVVYGTTEQGATPQLSWLGVLGYSIASAIPGLFVIWLGPQIKQATKGKKAFSTTDFCRIRYGRVLQFSCAAISVFYMWIYLVAEFTSISNVYALLVGETNNVRYTTSIAVSIGVITVFYTGIAGLPSSIITDKFQGIVMAGLVLLLTIAVCFLPENRIPEGNFALASNWTDDGFYAMITLILAIISAELFNQATWQRVWAAKDTRSMRRGFGLGSFLVFLLMMFFGVMGIIAYANDPEAYDSFSKFAFLAFFDLLDPLNQGWHVLVLIFVTCLAASSVDSLQNGITSILSADFIKAGASPTLIKWLNRLVLLGVNIAAIVKSSQRYDVLSLFLVADLVCSTAVFPVFLGLLDPKKYKYLSPTELGAFVGIIGGIATVLVIGVVVDSESYGSRPFQYFWLKVEGTLCSLCGTTRMWTFVLTPLFSLIFTVLATALHLTIFGEEVARKPIIRFSWDDEDRMEEEV